MRNDAARQGDDFDSLFNEMQALDEQERIDSTASVSDFPVAAAAGAGDLAAGAGWLFDSETLKNLGGDTTQFWESRLSEAAQQDMAMPFVEDGEDGGLEFGAGASNPRTWALMLARSAPAMVPGMGAGTLAKGLTLAAGKGAQAASTAGAIAGSVTEGGTIAGFVGQETEQAVMNMPQEILEQSPLYQDLLKNHTPEKAREKVAEKASEASGFPAGIMGAIFGYGANKFLANAVLGRLKGTRAGNAQKGFVTEGLTETAQGATESTAKGLALSEFAGKPFDTTAVANETVASAALGTAMGAGIGAAAPAQGEQQVTPGATDEGALQTFEDEDLAGDAQPQQEPQPDTRTDQAAPTQPEGQPDVTGQPQDGEALETFEDTDDFDQLSQALEQADAREGLSASMAVDPGQGAIPQPTQPQTVTQAGAGLDPVQPADDGQQRQEQQAPAEGLASATRRPSDPVEKPEAQSGRPPQGLFESLQNRDRGRAAMREQVESIARDPDYNRVSISRDPATGAPMVFGQGSFDPVPDTDRGRTEQVTIETPNGDTRTITAQYAVVEGDQVKASHDAAGRPRSDYGTDGLNALNNGRMIGLAEAQRRGTANKYTNAMMADESHGVPQEAIAGKDNPVLVRLFDASDLEGIEDVGAASNIQPGADLSASEQARSDARLLDSALLDRFKPGGIDSEANREFVSGFVGQMAPGQANEMMTGAGMLTKQGRDRIEGALVARAYDDPTLVSDLTENLDEELRSFGQALVQVAGQWAKMRDLARDGAINPAVDITEALVDAVNMIRTKRQRGTSLADQVAQVDAFSGDTNRHTVKLLELIHKNEGFKNIRRRDDIVAILSNYAQQAMQTSAEPDLMGEITGPDELLEAQRGREPETLNPEQGLDLGGPATDAGGTDPGRGTERRAPEAAGQGLGAGPRAPVDEAGPGQQPEQPAETGGDGDRRDQSEQQQPGQEPEQGLELTQPTQADLERQKREQEEARRKEREAEQRAKADEQLSGFQLVGSQRPVDTNSAGGSQQDFLVNPQTGRDTEVGREAEEKTRQEATQKTGGQQSLDEQASQADTDPSPAQIEAGNYQKGHITLHGLDISIENPRGSIRRGTDPDGNEWERTMAHHYGYIKRTDGADGDQVDVFVGRNTNSKKVFVVDQVNPDGTFDEHKVMLGFKTKAGARKGYKDNYERGWKVGPITEMTLDDFKAWLKEGDQSRPVDESGKSREIALRYLAKLKREGAKTILDIPEVGTFEGATIKKEPGTMLRVDGSAFALNGINLWAEVLPDAPQVETTEASGDVVEQLASASDEDIDALFDEAEGGTSDQEAKGAGDTGQDERETTYRERWRDRLNRLKQASSEAEISAIMAEEMQDGDRDPDGTQVLTIEADTERNRIESDREKARKPKFTREQINQAKELAREAITERIRKIRFEAARDRAKTVLQPLGVTVPRSKTKIIEAVTELEQVPLVDSLDAFGVDVADSVRAPLEWISRGVEPATGATESRDSGEQKSRTAGEIAKSLGGNVSSAGSNAIKGLEELFGGKGRLGSGLAFDEETYAKAKPHFKALLKDVQAAGKDLKDFISLVLGNFGPGVRPYVKRFAQDLRDGTIDLNEEADNAPGQRGNLESDSGDSGTGDALGQNDVPVIPAEAGGDTGGPDGQAGGQRGTGPDTGASVPAGDAAFGGERGDQPVHHQQGKPAITGSPAGSDDRRGGGQPDGDGAQPESGTAGQAGGDVERVLPLEERLAAQDRAEEVPTREGDLQNIRDTLPVLLPKQQEDVHFAEQRLRVNKGHGVLVANGTGTGKTFSGLGVIKRYARQGRDNVLIVAPNDKIMRDWASSAQGLNLDIKPLADTQDNGGSGPVITTYANFRQNMSLVHRQWDLLVFDESHYLRQSDDFDKTSSEVMRDALTGHPRGRSDYHHFLHADEYAELDGIRSKIKANNSIMNLDDTMDQTIVALEKENKELEAKEKALADRLEEQRQVEEAQAAERWEANQTDSLFLSATPFPYVKSVDQAAGYLFDYGKDDAGATRYNAGDAREKFFMEKFGFRMRYNRLTQPEAGVDRDLMEREFTDQLMRTGAMRARMLEVEADYDRRFYLIEDELGKKVDDAFEWLREKSNALEDIDPEMARAYRHVSETLSEDFKYLQRAYFLEALKAKHMAPIIKDHLKMGRKVVVFHDFNKGGSHNPLHNAVLASPPVSSGDSRMSTEDNAELNSQKAAYQEALALRPDLFKADFSGLISPRDRMMVEFGDDAMFINGKVPKKERQRIVEQFNTDDSGKNLVVVQADAGREGISLHDTTGKNQRVLINLGLPSRPVAAIQTEGRIYRTFVQSNAIQRYVFTGLGLERMALAQKLAGRSSTAENLALGSQARGLRDSIIMSLEAADTFPPGHQGEGTGGKAFDSSLSKPMSDFERAKTYYFARQKMKGRRDQREGVDFFPTPEPLGAKMVEWAGLNPGEEVLEPSAGDGAILRFAPEDTDIHFMEASPTLASKAALAKPAASHREGNFESLDLHNKYHAILMNPPYGQGGKTAWEHVQKASRHLKDGGRIIAIVPDGPAANRRQQAFQEHKGNQDLQITRTFRLPNVTFDRAGTGVKTKVLVIDRHSKKDFPKAAGPIDIEAQTIGELFDRIEGLEVPGRKIPDTETATPKDDGPRLETAETVHAKRKVDLFVARIAGARVPRSAFDELNKAAKSNGGYYSAFNKNGAIPGFQFESESERGRFLEQARPIIDRVRESGGYAVQELNGVPTYKVSEEQLGLDFSQPLPDTGTADVPKKGTAGQILGQRVDSRQFVADYIRHGLPDQVIHPGDAAHVLAPFRKKTQETMLALVLDKDRRPLGVIRNAVGAKDSAAVDAASFLEDMVSIPGARHIWLAHNHPSGKMTPSGADLALTKGLNSSINELGMTLQGHLLLGIGRESRIFTDDSGNDVTTLAAARKYRIPVMDRRFTKRGRGARTISGPIDVIDMVETPMYQESSGTGFLLLSNSHAVNGFLDIGGLMGEGGKLRDTPVPRRFVEAAGQTGSLSVIPIHKGTQGSGKEVLQNMARMVNRVGNMQYRVLDGILVDKDTGNATSMAQIAFDVTRENEPFFSRKKGKKKSIGKDRVQSLLDRVTANWGNAPPMKVVENTDQLPERLAEYVREAGAQGEVRGVFWDGEVHLIADNITSEAETQQVILHELVGHFGLRAVAGQELQPLLNRIWASQGGTKRAGAIINTYFPDGSFDPGNPNHRAVVAEELVAHMAEDNRHYSLVSRIAAVVQDFLRSVGFDIEFNARDIQRLLRRSHDLVADSGISRPAPFAGPSLSRAGRSGSDRTPWPFNFPRVPFAASLGAASNHPRYAEAKAGDTEAARQLVEDIVSGAAIDRIREMVGDRNPVVVPVNAQEATGANRIPAAYAAKIAKELNLEVDASIVQSVRAQHTNAGADHRLANHAVFDGEVTPGKDYLIVDDTVTMGGTLAGLRGHIERKGGRVIGATTLTGFGKSGQLALGQKMRDDLWRKHGKALDDYLKEEFGYGIDSLTQGEAGHLRKAVSLDAIRDRIAAARLDQSHGPADESGSLSRESGAPGLPDVEESTDEDARRYFGDRAGRGSGERPGADRTVGGGRPRSTSWRQATRLKRKTRSGSTEPVQVWRGSDQPLTRDDFRPDRLGKASGNPNASLGVWFTTNRDEAGQYGNTEPFYLDLRKPKVYTADTTPQFTSQAQARLHARKLQQQGYDGIVFDYRDVGGGLHVVAFAPDQVVVEEIQAPRFSLASDKSPAQKRQASFFDGLASQPIDRMFRFLFDVTGQVDAHGRWRGGVVADQKIRNAITQWKPHPNGKFQWLDGILETARAGLIDRYGLSDDYNMKFREAEAMERGLLAEANDILKSLQGQHVNAPEARVLQAVLTGEQIPDSEWGKVAIPIRRAIDDLGRMAVEYGIISEAAYQRNRGTYLHRSYLKHEGQFTPLGKWAANLAARKRRKIHGDAAKRRGMDWKVGRDKLMRHVPVGWYGKQERADGKPDMKALNGKSFVILQNMGVRREANAELKGLEGGGPPPRVRETVYWPADLPVPARYDGWENKGTWQVRAAEGARVILHRDYTKAERESMGEILDARYNIAKTFETLSHDIAMGKFFHDISTNSEWFRREKPDGVVLSPREAGWLKNHNGADWVEVPNSVVEKSGGTKQWGALAGGFVRPEIWRDLNELDKMHNPDTWRKILTSWKLMKTARSPVVHMNNVMSNLMLMDMVDVRVVDLVRAIKSFNKKDSYYQDAAQHGAFEGTFVNEELRREVLEPMLAELAEEEARHSEDLAGKLALLNRVSRALFNAIKAADRKMTGWYQAEDELFRMATYMRRLDMGDTPAEAALMAREQFLDYDIRAPWVNAARRTVIPFIAYTYRAVPVVAQSIMHRPWKLAKYATIAYLMNALGYALEPGDEDEERRTMRDIQQGYTWLGTPRMIRMPSSDEHGNPMFLDVRRWVPAGDVFDTNQGTMGDLGIPAPLHVGGPLLMGFELALNKQAFTGGKIFEPETDTGAEIAGKVGGWAYKNWMPSAPWVPGSWYFDKVWTAAEGGRDILGRPYSVPQALLSSFGVKLQPHDVKLGYYYKRRELDYVRRKLMSQVRQLQYDRQRNLIEQDQYEAQAEIIKEKLKRLQHKAEVLMGRAQ